MPEQKRESRNYARPWDVPGFSSWLSVVKVHHACEAAMSQAMEPLGLSLSHYDILANLERSPDLPQRDLVAKLLVGKSAVSMTLPELERRGLITRARDPVDGRIRRLSLTDAGRDLTTKALAVHADIVAIMMEAGGPSDADAVAAAMGRIQVALQAVRKD
ncbi:winged helix-turn-helix transcriptional regulator [Phreatobacter aquaticus]|uniref:Winged helix-turn-helix transcriptional regulator n=1 Tax=Phreatobacter aquaticus TaxID=2570229 RepID=A0A4D7QIC7_9HYPH|nr:MarR family winged helix-turn-helix transcriptional regulator [Phreatobacter aquaticus]QCK86735.1 winged helix-turn-helix transcriptional regulator [Phreatobacter aquaticus]